MILFLLLLFPISIFIYLILKKESNLYLPLVIGFVASVIVFVFKIMFTYSHRLIPYSFGQNFGYYLVSLSLVPVFIPFAIYCLLTKDKLEIKLKAFFPLAAGFMSVYLPYFIISTSSVKIPFFNLFIIPLLILSMLFNISTILSLLYNALLNKKIPLIIVYILTIIVFTLLPSVIISLYDIGFSLLLISVLSVISIFLPLLFTFISIRSKLKK